MKIGSFTESLAKKLVAKYPLTGPYYTSYPSVGQWDGQFKDESFISALDDLFVADGNAPLSLYLHYPFCPELCTYCSCHVIISNDQDRMDHFLSYIFKEIDCLTTLLPKCCKIKQLPIHKNYNYRCCIKKYSYTKTRKV